MRPQFRFGLLLCLGVVGCSARPRPRAEVTPPPPEAVSAATVRLATIEPPPEPVSSLRDVFPYVRVNAAQGLVEFDATVCIDAHNPKTPRVYLEAVACIPDTKEHESLVVTKALPSHVHAALLLLSLQPGKPGTWDWEGTTITPVPPTGPKVSVTAEWAQDGRVHQAPMTDWVINVRDNRSFTAAASEDHFVFAGSQMLSKQSGKVYRADGEGCLVGLCTFGGETIAWTRLYSPDTSLEEPQWMADPAHTPPFGTPVVVRISRAD